MLFQLCLLLLHGLGHSFSLFGFQFHGRQSGDTCWVKMSVFTCLEDFKNSTCTGCYLCISSPHPNTHLEKGAHVTSFPFPSHPHSSHPLQWPHRDCSYFSGLKNKEMLPPAA